MANDLIRFNDDAGELVQYTAQDVKARLCQNATDGELALLIELCNRQRLNPFTKDVYLVKYGNQPAQIITNYQVYNKRAQSFEDYKGIESGVVYMTRDGDIQRRRGAAVYRDAGEKLLGGWAEVEREGFGHTFYSELALADYSTGKSNWAKMPGVMIEKCAKVAAWRLAFPAAFQGMYTREEMGATGERIDEQPQPAQDVHPVETVDLSPIRNMFRQFCEVLDVSQNEAMELILAEVNAPDMKSLSKSQVRHAVSYMEEEITAGQATCATDYEVVGDEF